MTPAARSDPTPAFEPIRQARAGELATSTQPAECRNDRKPAVAVAGKLVALVRALRLCELRSPRHQTQSAAALTVANPMYRNVVRTSRLHRSAVSTVAGSGQPRASIFLGLLQDPWVVSSARE